MPANSKQLGLAAYPARYPTIAAINASGKIVAGTPTSGQYGTNGFPWGNNFLIDISTANVDLTIEDVMLASSNGLNRFTIVTAGSSFNFTFTPTGTQTINGSASAATLSNVGDFIEIYQNGTQAFKIVNSNILAYQRLSLNPTATSGDLLSLTSANLLQDSGINSVDVITRQNFALNNSSGPIKQPVKLVIDTAVPAFAGQYTQRTAVTNGNACFIDTDGSQYITGDTSSAILNNVQIGVADFILNKYQSNGTLLWTKTIGAFGGSMTGKAIVVNGTTDIYVTGQVNFTQDGTLLDERDCFIAKFNTNGTLVWFVQLGGVGGRTSGNTLALDSTNSFLYVAGYTSVGLNGQTQTGTKDYFVSKYDLNGNNVWTRQSGVASKSSRANTICFDTTNVYIGGSSTGGLNGQTQTGIQDKFIAQYDLSGTLGWTSQSGSPSSVSDNYTGLYSDNVNVWGVGQSTNASYVAKYNVAGTLVTDNTSGIAGGRIVTCTGMVVIGTNLYIVGYTNGAFSGGGGQVGDIDSLHFTCDMVTLVESNVVQSGAATKIFKYLGCSYNGTNITMCGITNGTFATAPQGLFDYILSSDVSGSAQIQVGGITYTATTGDVVLAFNQTPDADSNTFYSIGASPIYTWTKTNTDALKADAFVQAVNGTYIGKYFGLGTQHRSLGLLQNLSTPSVGTSPTFLYPSPSGKWMFVTDSTTSLKIYSINPANGSLTSVGTATVGSSPERMIAVIIEGKTYLYVAAFSSNAIYQYSFDDTSGVLTPLTPAFISTGASTAPIGLAVDDTRTFIFVALSGNGRVGSYRISPDTGNLISAGAPVLAGTLPYDLCFRNGFVYVGNYTSATISIFKMNTLSGTLTSAFTAVATRPNPRGISISPNGLNLYVASTTGSGAASIAQFSVNPTTGAIAALSPAFQTVANFPTDIAISADGYYLYTSIMSNATLVRFTIGAGGLLSSPIVYNVGANVNCVIASRNGNYMYTANTSDSTASVFATDGINYSNWSNVQYPLNIIPINNKNSAASTNYVSATATVSNVPFTLGSTKYVSLPAITLNNVASSAFNLNQVGKYKITLSCAWKVLTGVGSCQASLKVASISGNGTATTEYGTIVPINRVLDTDGAIGTAYLEDFVTVTSVLNGSVIVNPTYTLALISTSGMELSNVVYTISKI